MWGGLGCTRHSTSSQSCSVQAQGSVQPTFFLLQAWQIVSSSSSLCAQQHCDARTCLSSRVQRHSRRRSRQLCAFIFVATFWKMPTRGCNSQVCSNFWPCSMPVSVCAHTCVTVCMSLCLCCVSVGQGLYNPHIKCPPFSLLQLFIRSLNQMVLRRWRAPWLGD